MEHRCLSPWKGAVVGGPIAFACASSMHAWDATGPALLQSLLAYMIGAFLWTWILGKIPGLTLKDAAVYGLFFGLAVGVLGAIPVATPSQLPFAALSAAGAAIAWTLASLAISRCYAAACALPGR